MGGISGYFGGWVDTLIMRLVEVFYCIPSLPIMIIIGAYLDAEQVNPYVRLVWLMAVLGFLAGFVARLVRADSLLREQEFMLATEVGGLGCRKNIPPLNSECNAAAHCHRDCGARLGNSD